MPAASIAIPVSATVVTTAVTIIAAIRPTVIAAHHDGRRGIHHRRRCINHGPLRGVIHRRRRGINGISGRNRYADSDPDSDVRLRGARESCAKGCSD
jgi:hypothetical protein